MSQKYSLLVKGTSSDNYVPYAITYDTLVEANAAAQALVGSPDNYFAVLVMAPSTEFTH